MAAFVSLAATLSVAVVVLLVRGGSWLAAIVSCPIAVLMTVALVVTVGKMVNRVHIELEASAVRIRHGPFLKSDVSFSFREAADLTVEERRVTKGKSYVLLRTRAGDEPLALGAELASAEQAKWVILRVRQAVDTLQDAARAAERTGYRD
jgi:hypothetical protein